MQAGNSPIKPVELVEADSLMTEQRDKSTHPGHEPFEKEADCSELTARSVNYT